MTRRELLAMFGSAALLKGQNCNIATLPSGFVGPIQATRAVSGFKRPFDFGLDPQTGTAPYDGTLGGFMFRRVTTHDDYPNCSSIIHHPGMDINNGAGWDDFGLPVYACADGVVVYVRPVDEKINPNTGAVYTVGEWMQWRWDTRLSDGSRAFLSAPPTGNTEVFREFTGTNSWVGVIIQHRYMGKFYYSLYGHVIQIDRTIVKEGVAVCKGTQIAKIGSIGAVISHLHFEIRKPNHPHLANEKGFCTDNVSDANLTNYYYNPIRSTDTEPGFVDQHPSYDTLITNEIAQGHGTDVQGSAITGAPSGTIQMATGPLPPEYSQFEVRTIPFTFSGGKAVQIYHFLDLRDETRRTASYYDPEVSAFKDFTMPKLD